MKSFQKQIIKANIAPKELNIDVKIYNFLQLKFTAWSNTSYCLQPLEGLLKLNK